MAKPDRLLRVLAIGPVELINKALPKDQRCVPTFARSITGFSFGYVTVMLGANSENRELRLTDFDAIAVVGYLIPGGVPGLQLQLRKHNQEKYIPPLWQVLEWSCECGAREPFLEQPDKRSPYYDHRCPNNRFSMNDVIKMVRLGSMLTALIAACLLDSHTTISITAIMTTAGVLLVLPEIVRKVEIGGNGLYCVLLAMLAAPAVSAWLLWSYSSLTAVSWAAGTWLGIVCFFFGTRTATEISTRMRTE